jgi:hypothetical protein
MVGGRSPAHHRRKVACGQGSRYEAASNPNAVPVSVRVVYIVYNQPASGTAQQAVAVTPVGTLTSIPANGTVTIPVSGAAKAAVDKYSNGPAVSIKAYFSQ